MKKTSRRDFGKKLGLTLGALPIAALATETVTGQKRRRFTGDPITVGGGGGSRKRRGKRVFVPEPVFADFTDTIYTPAPQGPKHLFSHVTNTTRMRSLLVMINNVPYNLTPFLPPSGECHIKLDGKGEEGNEDIEIWGDAPVRIKFHIGKYPKTGRLYKSNDAANFIKKIKVDTDLGKFERVLTAADEVRIITDTVS